MRERTPAIYILANYKRGTLYISVIDLIEADNPDWHDLTLDYGFEPVSLLKPPDMDPGSSPG